MKTKCLRLIGYARELCLLLFFYPLGRLCAHACPKYRNLWLVGERGDDARDNGYWFYRHLREEHPEVNCRYAIADDSVDAPKIAALGGALRYRSFRHYLAYYAAKNLISTHVQPCAPDKMIYYHLAKMGVRPRGKQVFLQHGVTLNDMHWLDAEHACMDLFVCGAQMEYDHIRASYGYSEGVVQYLGFCRFDHLIRAGRAEKMILAMPTWRGSNYPGGADFPRTQYCRAWNELLNSASLYHMLEENGCTLIFYPHIEMQKYMGDFHTSSDRVILADKSSHDVQDLLMRCGMLITDYSSVFFDVAYLKKPVLYYQFDEEEFYSFHYKKGYFDFRRDGFGAVCTTQEELLAQIDACLARSMTLDAQYQQRSERSFPLRDDENCRRTYDAICRLNGKS